jgi:hypothetical protein
MKSLFFGKTKQLSHSANREDPFRIMIMMVVVCVLVFIALSHSILEKRHFDRYSDDVITASRLAEEVAGAEVGKIAAIEFEKADDAGGGRLIMGEDGTTEFQVEKRMIPGPPGGGPRIAVIVKWEARGKEKKVYLTKAVGSDILTAAH